MSDTAYVSAKPGQDWPRIVRFETQDQLEDYVETHLNEEGRDPTVALIDSRGTQTIAYRTAPGGDGYGFEFCMRRLADTGEHHCCWCSHESGEVDCPEFSGEWMPTFPVWVFEMDPKR